MSQPSAASVTHQDVAGADSPLYTVRAVARRLGLPTATLRSWSQRYGIGPSGHSPGRHRLYSRADIAVVELMPDLVGKGSALAVQPGWHWIRRLLEELTPRRC